MSTDVKALIEIFTNVPPGWYIPVQFLWTPHSKELIKNYVYF
jgi:hypothetical protein